MVVALVGVGSAVGAVLRYACIAWGERHLGRHPQWVLAFIDLTAVFCAGVVVQLGLGLPWTKLLLAGVIGGYSTFSAPIVSLAVALADPDRGIGRVVFQALFWLILSLAVCRLGMWCVK